MKNIKREDYLKKLRALKDQNLIKVVTGVRRAGKSTLLKMFFDELLEGGVKKEQLHFVNFEDPKFGANKTWTEIYDEIDRKLIKNKMNYVFLDEVQYIDEFERLLVGLQTKENVDLYVTGSNAHMLSSELATLLSGRSFEINVLPFSFAEYCEAMGEDGVSAEKRFDNFLNYGGFPQAAEIFKADAGLVDDYLAGIYETIAGRDIMDRGKVADKITLNRVTKYLLDNIGNFSSNSKIAGGLSDNGGAMSHHTVQNYVDALVESYLFYPVNRLHLKGREILRTQTKYYAVDLGLRNCLLGREAGVDRGHILENVVYFELLRRGNAVWIGKDGDKEVDFVVQTRDGYSEYYQVAWTVRDGATLERELAPFRAIKDYSPRFLITMDTEEPAYDGIRQINAINWLLKK